MERMKVSLLFEQLKNIFYSPHLPQHVRHNVLSWLCLLYALLIIAIGVALPITLGWDLAATKDALDQYLEFYIFLYSAGICYFFFYHAAAKTLLKLCIRLWSRMRKCYVSSVRKMPSAISGLELVSQSRSNDSRDNESKIKIELDKISSGQYGLKCGIKSSVVVFVIMILIELSAFIHSRMKGIDCQIDARGMYVSFQLVYVIFQTCFVLNTNQENVERYWLINHLGVAHLIATTISTGMCLTAYHGLLNLFSLQEEIRRHENVTFSESVPAWVLEKLPQSQKVMIENSTEQDLNPCSLKSYINEVHTKVKPFTFTFTMFYVYCCCILLVLLYFHLRKKLYRSPKPSMFFKIINPKAATFSSGASLSLIVVSVITSILTLNANDNIYVGVFLLCLHTQASIVGLVALCRIAGVPCSRKLSPSKYPTIYLIFYFFVMLGGTLEIIGKTHDIDEEEPLYVTIVEVSTEVVDLLQAFLHGLLILVGFSVQVAPDVIENKKMPREILIHLAATNFSALLSGVFNSKAVLFKNMQKMVKQIEGSEISATIGWSIMDSILSPCEEFNRFTTIIYLIKLFKIWSPHTNP